MDEKDTTVLLAFYKENCDQARHHETQRERVTAISAQTAGVILGLFGLGKAVSESSTHLLLVVPIFLISLGIWGLVASWKHNERSSFHRERIRKSREKLSQISGLDLQSIINDARKAHNENYRVWPKGLLRGGDNANWIWFNILIAAVGVTLLVSLLRSGG